MKSIYKYVIRGRHSTQFDMPLESKIVHADIQNGEFCIWAQVDTSRSTERRYFTVVGTGWELEDDMIHRGTVLEGSFVWHIMEIV